MFTGLVSSVGNLVSVQNTRLRARIEPTWVSDDPIQEGESVAINGCCLTAVEWGQDWIEFDLSDETLRRTTFGKLGIGALLNLERAARIGDRIGGHFVQGHVDGVGEFVLSEDHGDHHMFRFRIPAEHDPLLIDKGSICLDGISLTVVTPRQGEFDTWIIPHTFAHTNLKGLLPRDPVNFELDMLAKHVAKLAASLNPA